MPGIRIGSCRYGTKEPRQRLRARSGARYVLGQVVDQEDDLLLRDLLDMYPDAAK
ncbi:MULTISPECIES: hypothetical protein [Streptomyces]|uniref:Uncharacterized protein n=1 Tax=Streptomyces canarius TaxID=285453 RepID=A0ABQ3DCN9_9ACTN|nr:hypothetical protein [Streptomyces canarius]GHA69443.1 hypothetical protein GCM10010345_86220 [Streptomyces canarius]